MGLSLKTFDMRSSRSMASLALAVFFLFAAATALLAVGVFTTDFDKQALATIMFGVLLTIAWWMGGTLLRLSKLRIVNAARPPGGGRGGRAPADPARPNPMRKDGHRTTGAQREDA